MDTERWQRVSTLFAEVVAQPAAERAAFLERAAAGDEALRQAVEDLLRADDSAGAFLSRPVADVLAARPADRRLAPETVGRYRLGRHIGRGGFGDVFEGWDPVLHRAVAIKLCAYEGERLQRRFSREAEIAARLEHPAIVTLFDFGIEDGLPYLVQELLAGEDLSRLIERREPLSLGERLRMLGQLTDAVAYAHGRGVLHRDLKPANVRVLPGGRIKVMDFGIAHLIESSATLTEGGLAAGTVAYMSPEQIRGEPLDERSDLYSLGVVAYELLTYRCPLEAESGPALMYRVLQQAPAPLRQLWHECPPALATLIDRCLAKRPDERPRSLAEVARVLDAIAASPASRVVPSVRTEDLRPFAAAGARETRWRTWGARLASPFGKSPLAAAVLGAVLFGAVLLGVGSLVSSWVSPSRDTPPPPTVPSPSPASSPASSPAFSPADSPPAGPAAVRGWVRVDARPWGELVRIVDADGAELSLAATLAGGAPFTPLRLELPAGSYTLELRHPRFGKPRGCRVEVPSAGAADCTVDLARVDAAGFLETAGL